MKNPNFGMAGKLISVNSYQNAIGGRMQDFHCHDYYELSLILSGDMTVMFESGTYKANSYCLIFSPPFTDHYIFSNTEHYYHRKNLLISPSAFNEYSDLKKAAEFFHPLISRGAVIVLSRKTSGLVEALFDLIEKPSDSHGNEVRSEREHLCAALALNIIGSEYNIAENDISLESGNYICAVLRYISENYSAHITAASLAERFYISRTKLMTDFKEAVGTTLSKHITFVRIEHAKAMLLENVEINEVAASCGFVDPSNFFRVFKSVTGMTPRSYRAENIRGFEKQKHP